MLTRQYAATRISLICTSKKTEGFFNLRLVIVQKKKLHFNANCTENVAFYLCYCDQKDFFDKKFSGRYYNIAPIQNGNFQCYSVIIMFKIFYHRTSIPKYSMDLIVRYSIMVFYNTKRPHKKLQYKTPDQKEQEYSLKNAV